MTARFEMKVDAAELARWRRAAKREGLSLSAWARQRLTHEAARAELPDRIRKIGARARRRVERLANVASMDPLLWGAVLHAAGRKDKP